MTAKFKYDIGQTVYYGYFESSRISISSIKVEEDFVLAHVDRGGSPEYLLRLKSPGDLWSEEALCPTRASVRRNLLERVARKLERELAQVEMELAKLKEEEK